MAIEIYMPQLGLTMTEGTVVRWLKNPGNPVQKGEPIAEIETDKTTAEIEAPADGVLGSILVQEGTAVPIGAILSHIIAPGEQPPLEASRLGAAVPSTRESSAARRPSPAEGHEVGGLASDRRRTFASPRARKLAYELGVDLSAVEASGPGGRIVEADVRRHADLMRREAPRTTPVARRLAEELGIDLKGVRGTGSGGRIVREDVEQMHLTPQAIAATAPANEFEPLTGIRRRIAERMAHSFSTAPHFYLSTEVEATALMRMRDGLLAKVEKVTGVRLTITDILIRMCAQVLREYPNVNAAWSDADDGSVWRRLSVNVGVAVALDNGLVVPVIHDADRRTLAEIAQRRADLVERARAGRLIFADLEGGTFTLTNLGMFRVDEFQAILNPPQAAILAVGRIKERPVALNGVAVVRPTMHLTLSADHRLLDGAQGARFLERLTDLIEEPYLLLE